MSDRQHAVMVTIYDDAGRRIASGESLVMVRATRPQSYRNQLQEAGEEALSEALDNLHLGLGKQAREERRRAAEAEARQKEGQHDD